MRVLNKNTHVDLATGRRTDQLVGDGQRVDVYWEPLTAEQLRIVRNFQRTMQNEVIPDIERAMKMRAKAAQQSRRWIVD